MSTARGIALVGAVAVAACLVVATPTPALAGQPSPQRHEATSAFDRADVKEATATCPEGETVLGGGAQVDEGGGSVILTGIVPNEGLTQVTASAGELPGHLGSWSVTAYVVCDGGAGLHAERVDAYGGPGAATVGCGPGKIVYLSGFQLLQPTGESYVDMIAPDPTLTRVRVRTRGSQTVAMIAYAVCAVPFDGFSPNHARTQATSANDLATPKTATVGKPPMTIDYGSWIMSAGAEVAGGGAVHVDGVGPNRDLDGGWARATAIPKPVTPRTTAFTPARTTAFTAVAGDSGEFDVTAYGVTIGSWY